MKRPIPLLFSALAATVLVAACGGEAATPSTTTAATTTTGATSSPTTTAAAGGSFEVVMDSFAYSPAELTVPVGATVTWTNRHAARHDVVAEDGTFSSPLFARGETFSFTFTEVGEYPYICSIHPGMKGTIIVTP